MARRVLGLVPARGGSKGVPRKNVRDLAGRPLIAHSIAAGLAARSLDRVIVSTEDDAIADIARRFGAETPFMRPAALAGDGIADTPVLAHAHAWLRDNEGYEADAIVVLRPTVPFRPPDLIDRCVARLFESEAESVRSVRDMTHYHPYWMLTLDAAGFAHPFIPGKGVAQYYQRQMLPPVYRHDGYCDVIRPQGLPDPCPPAATLAGLYGACMAVVVNEDPNFVNIDSEADFALAERIAAERGLAT